MKPKVAIAFIVGADASVVIGTFVTAIDESFGAFSITLAIPTHGHCTADDLSGGASVAKRCFFIGSVGAISVSVAYTQRLKALGTASESARCAFVAACGRLWKTSAVAQRESFSVGSGAIRTRRSVVTWPIGTLQMPVAEPHVVELALAFAQIVEVLVVTFRIRNQRRFTVGQAIPIGDFFRPRMKNFFAPTSGAASNPYARLLIVDPERSWATTSEAAVGHARRLYKGLLTLHSRQA